MPHRIIGERQIRCTLRTYILSEHLVRNLSKGYGTVVDPGKFAPGTPITISAYGKTAKIKTPRGKLMATGETAACGISVFIDEAET